MSPRSPAIKEGPTDEDLGEVIAELNRIRQGSGLSSVARVGQLVFERFFGGSMATWQSVSRNKDRSLRRLARRTDCPYSKSALHQAIRIHLVLLENPTVQTYVHIGPSHIVATLSLPSTQRAQLLTLAETRRLSVRQLRSEVERSQLGDTLSQGIRRGRPRRGQANRAVVTVLQAKKQICQVLSKFGTGAQVPTTMPELRQALEELETLCATAVGLSRRPSSSIPPPLESTVEVLPPTRRGSIARSLTLTSPANAIGRR